MGNTIKNHEMGNQEFPFKSHDTIKIHPTGWMFIELDATCAATGRR
jgi:hypothetical protein